MRRFASFAVVDWSGEAVERPKGLAAALARRGADAPELLAPTPRWSRQNVLDWLLGLAEARADILIGLDLSPAFPLIDEGAFFPGWAGSPPDGPALWALIDRLSESDPHLGVGGALRHPELGRYFRQQGRPLGDRFGSRGGGRLRECERAQQAMRLSPTSCFNLVGAAQVGKSSLTGMRVLHRLRGRVPIWPFDEVPSEGPLIVEIYTTIAAREAGLRVGRSKVRDAESLDAALEALGSDPHQPLARYDDHATDAMLTAAWLRAASERVGLWRPAGLTPELALTEGWTFGVP